LNRERATASRLAAVPAKVARAHGKKCGRVPDVVRRNDHLVMNL